MRNDSYWRENLSCNECKKSLATGGNLNVHIRKFILERNFMYVINMGKPSIGREALIHVREFTQ